MTITQTLSSALNAELEAVGFKKKGDTWYRRNDDIIAVINLQKSDYDATHFLNLGFWIRAIEDAENPREEQCHVRSRAGALWPTDDPSLADLLNLGVSSNCSDARVVEIRKLVRERVIPFLLRGSSLAGLTEIVTEFKRILVRRTAWGLLGVEEP